LCSNSIGGYVLGVSSGLATDRGFWPGGLCPGVYVRQSLKKRVTKENLEERSGERNVDSRFQVQLEEDEGSIQDRAGCRQVVC